MNAKTSASNLVQAVKDLSVEWQETKATWRDVKSAEFEQKFIDCLPSEAARATTVMGQIEAVLRNVRSDCE